MKIYLASRFSRRHECHELGQLLQAEGHEIVSRWTLPGEDHVIPAGVSAQAADSERRRFAMEDMEDVRACDWCISLMEEPRSNGRGGRHIEFGVALALGKRLTIIGPRETVFHHLDGVEHFDTVEDFKGRGSIHTVDPRPTHAFRSTKSCTVQLDDERTVKVYLGAADGAQAYCVVCTNMGVETKVMLSPDALDAVTQCYTGLLFDQLHEVDAVALEALAVTGVAWSVER